MAKFTKAHFSETAKVFNRHQPIWDGEERTNGRIAQHDELVAAFTAVFKESNPLFNVDMFLRACGYLKEDK